MGATTRSGLLPNPLRDRFGFTGHLEFYEEGELERVIARSAAVLGVDLPSDSLSEIARRSRGTPRIANRLLRRVRDYALVHGGERRPSPTSAPLSNCTTSTPSAWTASTAPFSKRSCGGSAGAGGLSTLAVAVGEEAETVESVVEPYLVRIGFLGRTPRGRVAMPEAYAHLGVAHPDGALRFDDL